MTLDIVAYQAKVYPDPPCWVLVSDVYVTELGQTVDDYKTISDSVRQLSAALRKQAISDAFRLQLHKGQHGFSQLAEPVDMAVVLMGRSKKDGIHHAGIFYEGKVLHATPTGTLYQDMASLGDEYKLMEFWGK